MKRNIIHSKLLLIGVFIISAIIMASYETIKELLFKGTLTPWQSHTITIIITSLMATLTASIMRSWVFSVLIKEQEIEAKEQALVSFGLILAAVNHIVNNVLNYLQLVKVDVDINGSLRHETLKLLEKSIADADKQMKILNKIQVPHDPDSYRGIFPQ